ncbi:MAG TPA: HD domain-containing protein [Acidimicrobiia bacterium]|nr:HD domain-containing protein [Acidimicrobiia bacterium]
MTPPQSVDELLEILGLGRSVFDEPDLDVLSHSLQTAEILASRFPDDPELICAGLVHDIADAAAPDEHPEHERIGYELVVDLLGPRVAELVGGHVEAKRYLAAVQPGYGMSARSLQTLLRQGGTMTLAEAAAFEAQTHYRSLVDLRRADDEAKDPKRVARTLEDWRPLLESVAHTVEFSRQGLLGDPTLVDVP